MAFLIGKVPCAFLVVIWLITVITLVRFCVIEIRTLRLMKDGGETASPALEMIPTSFISTEHDESGDSPLVALLLRIHEDHEVSNGTNVGSGTSLLNAAVMPLSKHHGSIATGLERLPTTELRGHLIIHVGPSKTATTSLQTDLTKAFDGGWLGDSIVYSGRYYRPFVKDEVLLLNRSESSLLVEARKMFHASACDKPVAQCCVNFTKELDALQNQTVILSDEAFANMWTTPAHFSALREAVPPTWSVTIVASYRRFYEWILSSKYQRDRTDRISHHGKEIWPSDGGRPLLPMFPDTIQTWRKWCQYTDTILENARGSFNVRILDLHKQEETVRTQFLCSLELSEACAMSRRLDSEPQTVLNSQETATILSLYYDAIATAAHATGLIGKSRVSRAQAREDIRLHHEHENHGDALSLPLQCPSADELRSLLNDSLVLERTFFSEMSNETAHVTDFWSRVSSQAYCWVNTSAVLSDPSWKQFFYDVYESHE